jgi:hypothetical protein
VHRESRKHRSPCRSGTPGLASPPNTFVAKYSVRSIQELTKPYSPRCVVHRIGWSSLQADRLPEAYPRQDSNLTRKT